MSRVLLVLALAGGCTSFLLGRELAKERETSAFLRSDARNSWDNYISCEADRHRIVRTCSAALDEATRVIRDRERQVNCGWVP